MKQKPIFDETIKEKRKITHSFNHHAQDEKDMKGKQEKEREREKRETKVNSSQYIRVQLYYKKNDGNIKAELFA